MSDPKLGKMPTSRLVEQFVQYALRQDDAELGFEPVGIVNELFRKLDAIEKELKSRPGDQRSALVELLVHSNPHVQLKAAKATLALAPLAARQVLQNIADTCHGPQRLEAGMTLSSLDDGSFTPS